MKTYKYMVATRCMTYNQASYIEDALHGFSIQNTTFPAVYIVVDDASTDGEPEIIKRWVQDNLTIDEGRELWEELPYGYIAIATQKGKFNSLFVILLLSENHRQNGKRWKKMSYIAQWNDNAKYLAYCEGDDYWTDDDKLQKQVDFLEQHPDYSFCVHNFKRYQEKEGVFTDGYRYKEDFAIGIKEYLQYWPTHPMTSVIRSSAVPSLEIRQQYKHFRDNHSFYLLLKKGLGYYMADVMGVYRITNKGMWTSLNSVGQVEIDLVCYLELYEHNKTDRDLKRKCINQYILYLTLCKENKVAPKKEIMKEMGFVNRIEASILMMYSKVRRVIKNIINNSFL